MAFTQQQADALEAAIATGATTVRYADRSVTYQDQAAMLRLLDRIRRELAGKPKRTLVHKVSFSRG